MLPPTPDGVIRISWSSLRRWEECGQKFLRVAQRRTAPRDERIFLPGSIADRVMRAWLESDNPQPGQMPEMVRQMTDKLLTDQSDPDHKKRVGWRGDPREDRRDIETFVVGVVEKLEPILMKYVVPYDYHPELRSHTYVRLPGYDGQLVWIKMVFGIDIAVRESPTYYSLYDLKATANKDYIAKTLGQGTFYDLSFGSWIGDSSQPKRFGFIAPALEQQLHWATITDDDRRQMLSRIIRFVHGIQRHHFDPKEDDKGCSICEAKPSCVKFTVDFFRDEAGKHRASFDAAAERSRKYRG